MGDLKKSSVEMLFREAHSARIASAFAAAWGSFDSPASLGVAVFGNHSWASEALAVTSDRSLFDLASLTKIISGGTYFFSALDRGEVSLQETLGECLNIEGPARSLSLQELLTHTSGLPAIAEPGVDFTSYAPDPSNRGQVIYSDVGFLWLNQVFFKQTGRSIGDWFQSELRPSLRPKSSLMYRPVPQFSMLDPTCVATEVHPTRGLIQGQVHDDNTFLSGGESLHAGLFGSLMDVVDWCQSFFSGKYCSHRTLNLLLKNWNQTGSAPRAIAWDMPSGDGTGSTGRSLGGAAVGHLGFTGTSLWVDLDRGRFAILLTNRVHPNRNHPQRIRSLRRAFHATVFDT